MRTSGRQRRRPRVEPSKSTSSRTKTSCRQPRTRSVWLRSTSTASRSLQSPPMRYDSFGAVSVNIVIAGDSISRAARLCRLLWRSVVNRNPLPSPSGCPSARPSANTKFSTLHFWWIGEKLSRLICVPNQKIKAANHPEIIQLGSFIFPKLYLVWLAVSSFEWISNSFRLFNFLISDTFSDFKPCITKS